MLLCADCLEFSEVKFSHDTRCPGCGSSKTFEYDSHKYTQHWGAFTKCENRWLQKDFKLILPGKMPPIKALYNLLGSIPDREWCNELGVATPNPYKQYASSRKSI